MESYPGNHKDQDSASDARACVPSPSEVFVLQPGEILEADVIAVQAMRCAQTVEVRCNCSSADPDRRDASG
jgi:hypothetical protein